MSSSENTNHTGRFFGEVEGDTMKALVDEGVFKANTVYDFQAVCKQRQTKAQSSFGTILSTVGVYHLLYENVFLFKKKLFSGYEYLAISSTEKDFAMDCHGNYFIHVENKLLGRSWDYCY